MDHNPTGVVVPFSQKGPQTIKILARTRSVSSMKEGLAAVANMTPAPANANALGDLLMNDDLARHFRSASQNYVNISFRDIMSHSDAYTDAGRQQIEWEVANMFFGLATSMRDCLNVLRTSHSNEFAAADNLAEVMANYLYLAQSQRGA